EDPMAGNPYAPPAQPDAGSEADTATRDPAATQGGDVVPPGEPAADAQGPGTEPGAGAGEVRAPAITPAPTEGAATGVVPGGNDVTRPYPSDEPGVDEQSRAGQAEPAATPGETGQAAGSQATAAELPPPTLAVPLDGPAA